MNKPASLALLSGLSWLFAASAGSHPPAGREPLLVVTTTGVSAYDEVLDGLRKGLTTPVYVIDLRQDDAASILNETMRLPIIRAVVTIGAEAAETVVHRRGSLPVIAAAITPNLLSKDSVARGRTSIISLQIPPAALLENVKRVCPKKLRLGMIYNPTVVEVAPETLKAAAEAAGFKPRIVECAGPAQLLQVFQSLKDQVDLVLCFPDASLYNSATVKPLVLASLRYRLPLVGFSESFVRAGAAVGIYPNFREIGAQTADLALKALNRQPASRSETPRKYRVAVNQNITRLLGFSYSQPSDIGEDFLVIR